MNLAVPNYRCSLAAAQLKMTQMFRGFCQAEYDFCAKTKGVPVFTADTKFFGEDF